MSEEDWIPEQLRDAPYFRQKEGAEPRTPEQVLADLENASQLQGDLTKSHIRIPDKDDPDSVKTSLVKALEHIPGLTVLPSDDDPEAQEAFLKSIGRPESADGYKAPEGIDDGINLDPLREQALADGWTQKQFETFVNRMADNRKGDAEALEARVSENQAKLKAEWGAAYEDKNSQVKEFLSGEGVPENIVQAFNDGHLSVSEMGWLSSMAAAVAGEDMQIKGQRSASSNMTPSEAAEALVTVEKTLYSMKNTDPNFDTLVAKQEKLLRAMRGERAH